MQTNRIAIVALALTAVIAVSASGASDGSREPGHPSIERMRALIDGYARAIESNNLALASRYLHPRAPRRTEILRALEEQLGSHLERTHIEHFEKLELPDGSVAAHADQHVILIFGLKISHERRRSIYRFREQGGSWWIWSIEIVTSELTR
jgi:hypothetical protein